VATILIAEDDANIRLGLSATLESDGHQIREAVNGKEALQAFKTGDIDLVLLDVMMPELSGYEVCKQIRVSDQTTPVLMLTAKGEELDKVVGLKLGADDYITKPFGIAELLARIDSALRRAALC
jgi:DNA-binding response OmpR family regulator